MAHSVRQAKKLHQKGKTHEVTPHDVPSVYKVKSGHSGNEYFVCQQHDGTFTCNCPWGQYRSYRNGHRSGCSHVQAVVQYLEAEKDRATSAWASVDDAKRQHRPILNTLDGAVLTSRKV